MKINNTIFIKALSAIFITSSIFTGCSTQANSTYNEHTTEVTSVETTETTTEQLTSTTTEATTAATTTTTTLETTSIATTTQATTQPVYTANEAENNSTNERSVVITRTGKKYHSSGCRYVRGKSDTQTVSVSTASSAGLTACKVCGG